MYSVVRYLYSDASADQSGYAGGVMSGVSDMLSMLVRLLSSGTASKNTKHFTGYSTDGHRPSHWYKLPH